MHPLSHSHCGCSSGASTSASACAPLRPPPFCRRRHRFSQPAAQKSAAGGGGEEDDQLWFVTKFEERRRREEEERRQREADAQLAAAAGDEPLATNEQPPPPPPPPAPKATPPAAWTRAAALQSAQLAAGLAALILLPAALHPGGLFVGRVWLLYLAYFAFFAGGTVRRILEHGPLAAASTDRQRADAGGRAALAAFVTMMPVVHWLPLRRYLARLDATPFDQAMAAAAAGPALYDVAGAALVAAAVALNWRAAAALGRAYDRVVAPQRLVTAGPYALVQHPIYGSYMLLFCGFSLLCHSAPFALLAVWVCALYYRRRARLEQEVLQEAFGDSYDEYRRRTPKLFVPWIA